MNMAITPMAAPYVANGRSNSASVIDTVRLEVRTEIPVENPLGVAFIR